MGQGTQEEKTPPKFGFANQRAQEPASFCFVFFSQERTGAVASPHCPCVSLLKSHVAFGTRGGDPVEAVCS